MSKKHFIELANVIRAQETRPTPFTLDQQITLANFCQSMNPRFKRDRWLSYIAGECGPNGGKVKVHA